MKKRTALLLMAVMLLTALFGLSVTAHADPTPLPAGIKVEEASDVEATVGDDYTVASMGDTCIITLLRDDLIVSGTSAQKTELSFVDTVSSAAIKDLDTNGGTIRLSMAADDFVLRVTGENKAGSLHINHTLTMKGSGTLVCRAGKPTVAKLGSVPTIAGAVIRGSKDRNAQIGNMTKVEWFDATSFADEYLLVPVREYPEDVGDWCQSVVYAVPTLEESAATDPSDTPKTGDTTVLWNLSITALLGLAGFGMTVLRREKDTEN